MNDPALAGLVWVTVTPSGTSSPSGFMRLAVEQISTAGLSFDTWPGTTGATLEERANGDPNSDGFSNLVAYSLGASSAEVSVFSEGILLPAMTVIPDGISIAAHLARLPREDIIYSVETSSNLQDWTVIGWWTTDSSDEGRVVFSVEPTIDGGTNLSAIWSPADGTGPFARLRFEFR